MRTVFVLSMTLRFHPEIVTSFCMGFVIVRNQIFGLISLRLTKRG